MGSRLILCSISICSCNRSHHLWSQRYQYGIASMSIVALLDKLLSSSTCIETPFYHPYPLYTSYLILKVHDFDYWLLSMVMVTIMFSHHNNHDIVSLVMSMWACTWTRGKHFPIIWGAMHEDKVHLIANSNKKNCVHLCSITLDVQGWRHNYIFKGNT